MFFSWSQHTGGVVEKSVNTGDIIWVLCYKSPHIFIDDLFEGRQLKARKQRYIRAHHEIKNEALNMWLCKNSNDSTLGL